MLPWLRGRSTKSTHRVQGLTFRKIKFSKFRNFNKIFIFSQKTYILPHNSIFLKMTFRAYGTTCLNKITFYDPKRHFGVIKIFPAEFPATLRHLEKNSKKFKNFGLWPILADFSLSVSQRGTLNFQIGSLANFLSPKFFSAQLIN